MEKPRDEDNHYFFVFFTWQREMHLFTQVRERFCKVLDFLLMLTQNYANWLTCDAVPLAVVVEREHVDAVLW